MIFIRRFGAVLLAITALYAQTELFSWGDRTLIDKPVIGIATGDLISFAIKSDSTLTAWGDNWSGLVEVPYDLKPVIKVAVGEFHCIALQSDSTVRVWGSNSSGQSDVPEELNSIIDIAAGGNISAALSKDGKVIVWGKQSPSPPTRLDSVVAIAAGLKHVLALRQNGKVVAWGDNYYNQCAVPVNLPLVKMIASGRLTSAALTTDGKVICWGYDKDNLTNVPQMDGAVKSLVSGAFSFVARTESGKIYLWGRTSGMTIPEGNIKAIAPGDGHLLCLIDNKVVATGKNSKGQLSQPLKIDGVRRVFAAYNYSLALDSNGSIHGWGGDEWSSPVLTFPTPNENFINISVAAGSLSWQVMALRKNGTVAAWGDDFYELNDVDTFSNVKDVATTKFFASILRNDGTVYSWGNSYYLNMPDSCKDVLSIDAGYSHVLALRKDGKVFAWGDTANGKGRFGQTGVPENLAPAIAIAAGEDHSVVLHQDGTVTCWGENSSGQCNPPEEMGPVKRIFAGGSNSAAITKDGQLFIWGSNKSGNLEVPSELDSIYDLSLSTHYCLAVRGGEIPTRIIPKRLSDACQNFIIKGKRLIFRNEPTHYEIIDMNGRIVLRGSAARSVSIANLSSGMHLCRSITGGQVSSETFLVVE